MPMIKLSHLFKKASKAALQLKPAAICANSVSGECTL